MGYSHGQMWNETKIENALVEVMKKAKISTMPTHKLMTEITGNEALTNAVSKHGGSAYWAKKLGLEIKPCESETGREYERKCAAFLTNEYEYSCELTPPRYPYDVLVNDNIKIDVKVSNLYQGTNGNYYSFNLEKSKPTCDIFVCYCIQEDLKQKVYIIPSCVLSGKTQLSIGEHKSKYDRFIDAWDIVQRYDDVYSNLLFVYNAS